MAAAQKTSANFGFLVAHDRLLDHLGALAERYFADDPSTCLLKLRQFGEVLAQRTAASAGLYASTEENQVEACKANATAYTADDWRHTLLASLGSDAVDRDDAIRAAAEWARDNLGLEFVRLRAAGQIVEGLRSAINRAIRRGEVNRHGSTQISRVPSSSQRLADPAGVTVTPVGGAETVCSVRAGDV